MDNGSSGPPLEHPKHFGTWLTHLDGSQQCTFASSQLFQPFGEAWVGKEPQQLDSLQHRRLNPYADGYSPTIPPTDEEPSLCGSSVPSANPSPDSSVPFTNHYPRSSPFTDRRPRSSPPFERKFELDPESESESGSQLEPELQFKSESESESESTKRDALKEDGLPQLQETGNSGLCNPVHLRTAPALYPSPVRSARGFLSNPVDAVRGWRDSGYDSPPPSELHSFTRHAQQQDPLSTNEVANPDSSPGPISYLRRLQPFSSPHHLHTPYKNPQPREFECTYCIKEFVRPGDCLNHEEAYHNQEKKWICPHCVFQAETKNGCLRHHRLAHHCRSCGLKERVQILSKPKTACACPYCGRLFEGDASFKERLNHVDLIHYKGDEPKRRSDLDYTKMILSLLCRKELSRPWKIFISEKLKRSLTWTPKKARAIIPELEKGIFPNGVHYMLQKVYNMSTEVSVQPDKSQECTELYQSSNSINRFPIHSAPFVSACSFNPPAHAGAGTAPLDHQDLRIQSLPKEESADLGITAMNNTSSDLFKLSSHQKSNGSSGSQYGMTYRRPATPTWETNYKELEGLIMRISEIDSAAGITARERGYVMEIANGEEAKIEKSPLGKRVKLDLGEVERGDHSEKLSFSQSPDKNDDHEWIEFTTTAVNISNDLRVYPQTTQPVFNWLSKTIENPPPTSSLQSTSETPNPDDSISMKTPRNDDYSPGATSCDSGWWSEDSSDDIDLMVPYALNPFVKKAATHLFQAFETWRRTPSTQSRGHTSQSNQGVDSCNTSASASTRPDTAASMTSNKGDDVTKTPRKKLPSDDDEDEDERRPAQRRRLNPPSEDTNNRLLACPFAKNNPLQHRKCFKYVLQEIARLKQHLMRVHQTPIHCVRCSEIFGTEEERDSHLRQQPECTVQPPRAWDGINESKRRQLAKRISSKKTKVENWYLIYQILFPESHRPESPFVDDINLSEELQALREFASQEAPSRIATFVRSDLPPDLRPNQAEIELFTQAAVRDVFNTLVERWQSSQGASQQSSPVQSTSMNADSGYRSGEPSSAGNRSSTLSPPEPPDTSAPMPTDSDLPALSADGALITTSPIRALSGADSLAVIGAGDSFGFNPSDWMYPTPIDDGFAQLFTTGLN